VNSGRWHLPGQRWRPVLLEVLSVVVPAVLVLFGQTEWVFSYVSGFFACAVLPLRHRWPRAVLVLCLPALTGGLGWAPTAVAIYRVGRSRPNFAWLVPWILLASVSAILPVLLTQDLRAAAQVWTWAYVLLLAGTPAALGALVATRQQLTASLQRLQEATEAESFAKAETARAEERARIAREIHDAVGHHVTMIAVEASALVTTTEEPTSRESAGRLRESARAALAEIRTTLGLASGEDSPSTNLQAIPDLVSRARAAGVDVRLCGEFASNDDIAPGVGRAAYRVVQEALTNASKHAPGAGVTVRVEAHDGALRIQVSNTAPTGRIVDVDRGGSGLEGLSERVNMAGGQLRAGPSPEGGFELRAVLPQEQR
jgi:signal transduction histidine kinase